MVSAGPRTREHDGTLLPHRGELGAAGAAGVVVACPAGGQRVIIDLAAPEFNWVQHPMCFAATPEPSPGRPRRAGFAAGARAAGCGPGGPGRRVLRPSRYPVMTADACPGRRAPAIAGRQASWFCGTQAGLLVWLRVAGYADAS
jgi:hypothetical protein